MALGAKLLRWPLSSEATNLPKGNATKYRRCSLIFSGLLPLFALAHFAHHLLTALPVPLLPMIRSDFGLDYTQSGVGLLGFAFFATVANDNFFVVYGAWLEEAFLLSIVTPGITTTVIGVAELVGEGLTASLADRLGLQGWRPQAKGAGRKNLNIA